MKRTDGEKSDRFHPEYKKPFKKRLPSHKVIVNGYDENGVTKEVNKVDGRYYDLDGDLFNVVMWSYIKKYKIDYKSHALNMPNMSIVRTYISVVDHKCNEFLVYLKDDKYYSLHSDKEVFNFVLWGYIPSMLRSYSK